jgi:MYXO-CTERM domain-containing protein
VASSVKVRRGVGVAALAALGFAAPDSARANGAFPAPEAVIVPADRPEQIILVTNFGLVITEDGGGTWSWSCERDDNAFGILYQLGPAPRRRLFAVANGRVVYSDDASCSWEIAGGLLADRSVTDVFPDPTNAERVLAVGFAGDAYAVFESADGGATFGSTLYQASGGDTVYGVESARSDPRVIYVALMTPDRSPKLARTGDAGATWLVNDLSRDLGAGLVRIIAVDPDDADVVILRSVSASGGEAIGVTRDGGATATTPLSIPSYFTSFARMPDGALVVSGMAFLGQGQGTAPALFVSHDDGASFQENRAVPGVLAIAQRDGLLYAAADNFADGYALGASSDEGATWQPVVRYDQITSIMPCLRANPQCQASCQSLAGVGFGSPGKIWDEAVCAEGQPTTGAGGVTGGHPVAERGCATAAERPTSHRAAGAVVVVLFAIALRRRRRVTTPASGDRVRR